MKQFLIKGILRDRSRSLLPIVVVTLGVMLTVLLSCWISGVMGDMIELNANFRTGHVKVMTRIYADNADQLPNDLALMGVDSLMAQLNAEFPSMQWEPRINFGGLMDLPDHNGETVAQGPVVGLGINMLDTSSDEVARMNIKESLVSGRMPSASGEILISHEFAQKLNLNHGKEITFFGSTMFGSMAFRNFTLAGTIDFGSSVLDRGAIIVDLKDAQTMLDMDDAAGEILGFSKNGKYHDLEAARIANSFNQSKNDLGEFAPIMLRLKDQNQLSSLLDQVDLVSGILVFIFVLAMSLVLWNAGLLGGLRRFKEFGVRLALGEEKRHIYTTLLYESLIIGVVGSILGTGIGLLLAYYLQENGIDFSGAMRSSSMMMPSVYRAAIQPDAYYIGFIPGVFSMVLGTGLSGIGIYKRKTAELFKELEV